MADLAPLTYGRVVGRFLCSVGDAADGGTDPDVVAPTGTVLFTPTGLGALVRATGALPVPATLALKPIEVPLDANGYLSWNSEMGVKLVATNDPVVSDFTYTVTFDLELDGVPLTLDAKIITVPAGSKVDVVSGFLLPTNIFENPSFEASGPFSSYFPFGATVTRSSGWANTGTYSMLLTPNSGSNVSGVLLDSSGIGVGGAVTKFYTAMAMVRVPTPQTGSLYSEARRMIAFVTGGTTPGTYSSPQAPNTTGSHEIRFTFPVGSGTTTVNFEVYNGASSGNGLIYYDDFAIVEVPSLSEPYTGPLSVYGANSPYNDI